MPARLIETTPSITEPREYALKGEEFLIGRGDDCDLRLSATAISRHHCLIRMRGGEYTLADLGSSNGTYLNGQRLRSQAGLKSGDEIRVGEYCFQVDLGDLPRTSDPAASTVHMKQFRKSFPVDPAKSE